jgi:hypothetical protein
MLEQMKLIRNILILIILLSASGIKAQTDLSKRWTGETYLLSSFYRLGSYSKERPTLFLEQDFNNRLSERFSVGAGFGISLYPSLLAFPVSVNGKYHFRIKSIPFSIIQSYARHIKLSDVFFASNRYIGELRANLPLKKVTINPRLGYNFLWDKYGGKNLSFIVGVGIEYNLSRTK